MQKRKRRRGFFANRLRWMGSSSSESEDEDTDSDAPLSAQYEIESSDDDSDDSDSDSGPHRLMATEYWSSSSSESEQGDSKEVVRQISLGLEGDSKVAVIRRHAFVSYFVD
jgi:hypothetical protein